jgi:hypothetical protein
MVDKVSHRPDELDDRNRRAGGEERIVLGDVYIVSASTAALIEDDSG